MDYGDIKDMDRLTLTNSVSISAIAGLLVKKGIITQEEMVEEVRKIRAKLEEYDVPLLGLDSDGYVEPLIPNWLEAGVNVMFPLQPGSWGTTPALARQRFGRELRIFGGYDKLALERGPEAIDAELERHIEVMKGGGVVLMPDHLITPGTSLENYRYYIERMRQLRL